MAKSVDKFIDAVLEEDFTVMDRLLKTGYDINQANAEGETAFSYCCAHNKLTAAKFLHAHGADINAPLEDNATPLDWAVCWSSPEFREWLISIGGRRHFDYAPWPWSPPNTAQK